MCLCVSGDRGEAGDGRSTAQQQENTVQPAAGPRGDTLPRQPVPQQHGESLSQTYHVQNSKRCLRTSFDPPKSK